MKKSVNFNGYKPPAAKRRTKRAFSGKSILATLDFFGIEDVDKKEIFENMKKQGEELTPKQEAKQ